VDYHPQAYAAYIRNADGSGEPAPAEVSLSLTFKETEIISKQFLNPGSPVSAIREPDLRSDNDPEAVRVRTERDAVFGDVPGSINSDRINRLREQMLNQPPR
jgi:hypothetical protein